MTDKQFESYAERCIKEHKALYAQIIAQFKDTDKKAAFEKEYKSGLCTLFFSLRYERVFAKWERRNLKLNEDDQQLIKERLNFEPMGQAALIYICSVFGCCTPEAARPYEENPESANTPLTEKERRNFFYFLREVFKPALLDILQTAAKGSYRLTEDINADINKTANTPIETITPLYKELFRPREELENRAAEYAGKIGFNFLKPERTLEQLAAIKIDSPKALDYLAMYSGPALTELARINTNFTEPTPDPITGTATIKKGNLRVYIENERFIEHYEKTKFELKPSTSLLLYYLVIQLTASPQDRKISLPIKEYLEWRGKSTSDSAIKEARKTLTADLNSLFSISLEWTENSRKTTKDFEKMRICSRAGIKNGNIIFTFSPDFADYLTHAFIIQYPAALGKLDARNGSAIYIALTLALHYSIDHNAKIGTNNIISVKALLKECPTIPTYKEIAQSAKQQVSQRIIEPFEKALDHLEEKGVYRWEYCNSQKAPLTGEQLQTMDYKTWIELYIHFEPLAALPDQTERRKRNATAAKRKAAKASKDPVTN